MKKVIYGWSFDPITYGHEDVIKRALYGFDNLTVGIGVNEKKEASYLFSLQERLYLIREALKDLLNVDVVAYRGMTTHYAYENEYDFMIRWVRNAKDFEEEQNIELAFKRQEQGKKKEIDTFYLDARQSMLDLSSSASKTVLSLQGDIRDYVRMIVKQAMEWRLLGQYLAGITGGPWSWKSFTTEMFINFCKENGINWYHLDMDKVGHYILWTSQEPVYQTIRHQIIQTFGDKIANEDGSINRKILGDDIFGDPKKRWILDDIMRDPMKHKMNTLMKNQKWFLIYDAALIAEHNTSGIANNNIFLLNVQEKLQIERLQWRWLSSDKIQKMLSSQFTTEHKRKTLMDAIDQDKHGKIIEIKSPTNKKDVQIAGNAMLAQIDTFGELRFGGLLKRLGIQEDPKNIFMQLRNIYDRPIDPNAARNEITQKMKGSYHKRLHVVHCLNELYTVKHLLNNPDAVECALIFHDIVCTPGSQTNEEESVMYAEKMLTQRWLPKDFIEEVKRLIMVTKHGAVPQTSDEKYMIDIDRSVLGQSPRIYNQYTKDVRQEHYMYADTYNEKKFSNKRYAILKWFLDKDNILFHTEHFREKYQLQAEKNITNEIPTLPKE